MKIVHAAENIKGGVGSYMRDLLVMQRDQYGADVVTALVPASQRDMVQSPEGGEIVTFNDEGSRLMSTLRLAWRMRQIVGRTRPDVVHLHSTFAGAALRPLLRVTATAATVIYCAHGWAFDRQLRRPPDRQPASARNPRRPDAWALSGSSSIRSNASGAMRF